MSVNGNNNNNNIDSNIQNALSAIEAQYQQLEGWITQMHADTQAIHQDTLAIQNDVTHHRTNYGLFHTTYTTCDQSDIDAKNADITAKTNDLKNLAGEINNANHAAYGDLASAIDAIIDGISSSISTENSGEDAAFFYDPHAAELLSEDLTHLTSYLDTVIKALGLEIKQRYVEQEVDLLNQDQSNNSAVQALILESIGLSGQVQSTASNLNDQLTTDFNAFQTEWNNADHDKNGIHWVQEWFGNGYEREREDDQTMANAVAMENIIGTLKNAIAPVLATTSTEFQSIMASLDSLIQKLSSLLASMGSMSPDQLKAAIMSANEAIMNIFVMIVGLLSVVQQESAKEKAQSEETMSKGTIESATMGIAASQLQMANLEQDLKYASMMGSLMEVCKYTMMAVGAVAVPGIGSLIVGMILIALTASGVTNKLTDACEKKMGKLGAEIFVGGLEMLATAGGGMILDKVLAVAMEEVLDTVVTEVVETVGNEAAVKGSAEVAAKVSEEAGEAATPVLNDAVSTAANTAAKKAFNMFFQKNGVALTLSLIKSAWQKGVNGAAVRLVEQSMKTAAEEAATTAAKEVTQLLVIFGKESGQALTAAETKLVAELNEEVASAAAAKAMNVSVKDAAKVASDPGKLAAALKRAIAAGFYALGANDIIVESAQEAQDRWHKMSDDNFDKLKIALQALAALVAAMAQMIGTGAASQFMVESNAGKLAMIMKITNALQVVPTAANGAADYGMYESLSAQATATAQMGKIQTVLDVLMQIMLPEIEARRKAESDSDTKQYEQSMRSTVSLAAHSYDNLNYSASALQA